MRTRIFLLLIILLFSNIAVNAQLKPGFDADEYLELLRVSAQQYNDLVKSAIPSPKEYHREYRSPEVGLDNCWELWVNSDNTIMLVTLRGTTAKSESWMENFYAAMIPATGSMKVNDNYTFNYKFAADPKATVHVGWTLGIASMMPTILERLNACHKRGIKQLIIMGHSQGASLAFLLSSYLHYQAEDGKFPKDIVIKTYCSAAPSPGNLYYAYDYEYINRNGWANTVVNAADWVPETPFAVQTVGDFNKLNPFSNIHNILNKQNVLVRIYGRHMYNSMRRPTEKAQRRFEKNLGHKVYKIVRKTLPQFEEPKYVHTNNYTRAGTPIVLQPDAAYYKTYPDTSSNIFIHHGFTAYYSLVKQIYNK